MTQTLQQQVVVQPALQPTVTSSNDEKHLKIIKRISISVVAISVVSFLCGIATSLLWFSIWHGVWCPLLPFVAGILGIMLKSNSKSNAYNGVFIGFCLAGAIMSLALLILESIFVTHAFYWRASRVIGVFLILFAAAMIILLITLSVYGFRRCDCSCGSKNESSAAQQVVYVQSSNVQPANLVVPQNQQFVVQPNFGNQPVVLQMVPGGSVMVPGSNIMVPNANVNVAYQQEKVDVPPQYEK